MLTRSGMHAVRAMTALANMEPGVYRGSHSLAELTGAPPSYLGKVLLLLARHGLVESQKGVGGGFRLARDPREISLRDIVEAIEDVARWNDCAFGARSCTPNVPCPLHNRWARVRDAYIALLAETSLAELAATAHFADITPTNVTDCIVTLNIPGRSTS